MNGDFGALFQNEKQVGGFLNWTMSFHLDETTRAMDRMRAYTVVKWRTAASPYYWTAETHGDVYTADFYLFYEGELLLVSRNEVLIDRDLSEKNNQWVDKRLELKLV